MKQNTIHGGRGWLAPLALLLAAPQLAVADPALLVRGESLLNAGKPAAALAELLPAEGRLGGSPDFDYLLGLALLESGQASRAALTLERALLLKPGYHAARMELARAYFALGQHDAARREFEQLAATGPPPAAQTAIDEYLDRISRHTAKLRWSTQIAVRFEAGHDSNANSATRLNDFLGFQLTSGSRRRPSDFIEYGINGGANYELNSDLRLSGSLGVSRRNNSDASFVDSTVAVGRLALVQNAAGKRRALSLNLFQLGIEEDLNSFGVAVQGDWELPWETAGWSWTAYLRAGVLRYGDDLEIKDVDQLSGGITASRSLGDADRGFVTATLLAGRDEATRDASRYSRDLLGLRFLGGWRFAETLTGRVSASWLDGDYDEVFFAQRYDAPRSDRLLRAQLRLDWEFAPLWVLTPKFSYNDNSTEVEIYEFERVESSLSISRYWR